MNFFQNIILPAVIIIILSSGLVKKLPVFSIFIEGAEKALKQTADLLPALMALTVAVTMLGSSGASEILCSLFSSVMKLIGIPEEVLPLCIIAPFSGSGSIAALEEILKLYSPDSFVGRTASVIAGASETTFYAVAVYYGSVGITKTAHTIPAALTADITSYIAAALFCRIFS